MVVSVLQRSKIEEDHGLTITTHMNQRVEFLHSEFCSILGKVMDI